MCVYICVLCVCVCACVCVCDKYKLPHKYIPLSTQPSVLVDVHSLFSQQNVLLFHTVYQQYEVATTQANTTYVHTYIQVYNY